ncbi:SDR family oxidoreductase [Paracoccus sp. S-4012]|uniref:SDR family oxidoreductase n=1 Tax=Paracoccus sp. S-4012 TaxID=2665648 RepID=UPI0012B148C1|nr:SDR family NAD(P)-dependent oxidoreductase [Paracoccus sp. S-4012]MRX50501.1 SDR family oxidoreductase [Paracoccus sp. S-4012]
MELAEHRVVVTGAASGLGAATAAHLAAEGSRVFLLDREASVAETAEGIGGGHALCDVTDEGSAQAAIAAAVEHMGGITAAVNCAGIAPAARVVGREGPHPLDLFRRVIEVNLIGSFNIARLAAAEMAKNAGEEKGVIVNTASVAAFEGQKGQAAYAASKAGIAGLTLPMARDLAGLGIRVCAIAPGIFGTPMLRGLPQEVQDSLAAEVTFPRRLGEPEEFARTVAFILRTGYLNGEVIRLDGALRMR